MADEESTNDDGQKCEVIYHYCSMQSLAAILQSRSLRMSNVFYMNDAKEHEWFKENYDECVKSAIDSEDNSHVRDLWKSLNTRGSAFSPRHIYAACFSFKPDDLSLWRAYGADGRGAVIGFRRSYFSDLMGIDLVGGAVRYGADEAQECVEKTLFASTGSGEVLESFQASIDKSGLGPRVDIDALREKARNKDSNPVLQALVNGKSDDEIREIVNTTFSAVAGGVLSIAIAHVAANMSDPARSMLASQGYPVSPEELAAFAKKYRASRAGGDDSDDLTKATANAEQFKQVLSANTKLTWLHATLGLRLTLLWKSAAFFKAADFRDECEYRVVYEPAVNDVGASGVIKNPIGDVAVTVSPSNGRLRPSVDLPIFQDSMPIASIRLGPKAFADRDKWALEQLLATAGFNEGIQIVQSNVPMQ